MHKSLSRERGIAVVTAIMIATFVAALAFALTTRERLWLNQMQNRNDLAAAQAVAFAAIDLARLTLRDDMRSTQVDHLLESWTVPVAPIEVDEGKASGRLIEMQGRFNLFNLQSGGLVNQAGVVALQRLLATLYMPTDWAEKMAQEMASRALLLEKQQQASPGRIRPKLLPVANLSELADLSGIDFGKLAVLEPLVAILPETTTVNVNFASPEVLMALTPGLTTYEAEQLVSRRAFTYFKSVAGFVNALPERLRPLSGYDVYCVESQYFLSEVESWFGRVQVRYLALIYRQRNKMPELVWLRRR